MMDSQEMVQQDTVAQEKHIFSTKEDILGHINQLVQNNSDITKQELDYIKTAYYRIQSQEREAAEKKYIEEGGDPMQYTITPDPLEETFKAGLNILKEHRQQQQQALEAEKQANLKRKLEIIERIKVLAASPEEAADTYKEMKELQQEWKELKNVPAEQAADLWQNYQHYTEQFYDMLKLNIEAREYDFKKNLEQKTAICEAAEKLANEEDVVSAFHQLQELHNQFREIGPVEKELREPLWARFKQASTTINKRHADHFEALHKEQDENLIKKTELCDKVEMIDTSVIKTAAEWDEKTKEVIAMQAEWKTIGFAPKSVNIKIYERFRTACDRFFTAKNEYYAALKESYAENITKKEALVKQAIELADSTDWKATAEKLQQLQKDWKEIGAVPHRIGDKLWTDFRTACDKFFNARKAVSSDTRNELRSNLEKKQGILEQLKTLAESVDVDDLRQKVQSLAAEYNAVGHVPFKDKDELFKQYHDLLDVIYDKIRKSNTGRRLEGFKRNFSEVAKRGENAVQTERQKMQRRYDAMKQELDTYENNMSLFTASSQKGSSLISEMEHKIEKLRNELQLMKEKIKATKE